MVKENKQSKDK